MERRDREIGFVVEIKEVKDRKELESACETAMEQIEDRDYTALLRRLMVEKIYGYGIAFCDKRCRVVVKDFSVEYDE